METAHKAGQSLCPLTVTTQTAVSSVSTPIKTVSILEPTLTTPALVLAPVWMMRTCAGGSTGVGRIMKSVDLISDASMNPSALASTPPLPLIIVTAFLVLLVIARVMGI